MVIFFFVILFNKNKKILISTQVYVDLFSVKKYKLLDYKYLFFKKMKIYTHRKNVKL